MVLQMISQAKLQEMDQKKRAVVKYGPFWKISIKNFNVF